MILPQLPQMLTRPAPGRILASLAMAFVLMWTALPASAAVTAQEMEDCLIDRINADRSAAGVGQLQAATELVDDVRAHSSWMSDNAFQHMSDAQRLAILPSTVTSYAENIVMSGEFNSVDCTNVHAIIMGSSSHKANVLLSTMEFMTIGAHIDSQGVWVTELFFAAPGYTTDFNGTFWDDDDSPFEADIELLAAAGITSGCGTEQFCPDGSVTREQMAAFLVRALGLPDAGSAGFVDTAGNPFANDIDRLAKAGITVGCSSSEFCPKLAVTRGQMAAFLVRALSLPNAASAGFTDTAGNVFANDIDRLAGAGVTLGCGPNLYCPKEPITRAEMAAFLARGLGL